MAKIFYALFQSLKQIKRNIAMTFTSIFAITAMLLILGLFFMIIININMAAEMVKQDYNTIEVFLKDSTKVKDAKKLTTDIEKWKDVEGANFRSKDEAMDILKKRWGETSYLLEGLSNNPLPNSIVITISNLEKSDDVAIKAAELKGIEDVKYYKDTVRKLIKVTNIFQIAAVVIMGFLIVVSLVVVSNTIKLTVFNRAEEITIMKYIGATNWFIRAPFLFEGIIIGTVSALIASGLVSVIYQQVGMRAGKALLAIFSTPIVPSEVLTLNLVWIFLAIGVSIGTWGSIISMRRFLDT
ncbi:MAG: permease-like cell division protein FtsX [Anaerovoracaceae bacterium]